ncbi:phosphatase PAP2 family protein [Pseudarthrobacter phenanthrenivorans]|uniref:phosphatase PAP2 family protein n=1 Tax=Pseudarthrobacter phenanthrenivorans TaxID=361575 RepID=UPI00344C0535
MQETSNVTADLFPRVRSWWWSAAGIWLFAATIWAGFALTLMRGPDPDPVVGRTVNPPPDNVLVTVSAGIHYLLGPVGATLIVIVICLYLLWFRRWPTQALAFASIVIAGWLASTSAKMVVARPRPSTASTYPFITETGNTSFPSGHTAFAAALVIAITLVVARSKAARTSSLIFGSLFVAVVAFSRVYLGVHYVSDVIASVVVVVAATLIWVPIWNIVLTPRLPAGPLRRRDRLKKRQLPIKRSSNNNGIS